MDPGEEEDETCRETACGVGASVSGVVDRRALRVNSDGVIVFAAEVLELAVSVLDILIVRCLKRLFRLVLRDPGRDKDEVGDLISSGVARALWK